MIHIVVGGVGFIGQELIKELQVEGNKIIVVDIDLWDLATKVEEFREVTYFETPSLNWSEVLLEILPKSGSYTIWHLAANSDISKGSADFTVDYELTLGSTIQVINTAMHLDVDAIHFTSSSAVYGEGTLHEDFTEDSICAPISNYGVCKLASEQMLQNFVSNTSTPLFIYRLANIIGPKMTHGVIFDFKNKLEINKETLRVLGNGKQTKSYLHVSNLVKFMLEVKSNARESFVLNIGSGDSGFSVKEIANLVCGKYSPEARIEFENTDRGWKGDAPISLMNTNRLQELFQMRMPTSQEAVIATLRDLD